MSKRRILVTGGTGQVGTELLRSIWPEDVQLVAPTRQELDLSDCDNIARYISAGDFCAVINSAAYTGVDRAEDDFLAAWKVNALAPAALSEATKKQSIPLIQVSTDYVFDGEKGEAYAEDDPVVPLNAYGASKAAGEQAVRSGNPLHVIVRTSWVYSEHGSNFVKTMLRLREQGGKIRVVNDQQGCPTSAADLAEVLSRLTLALLDCQSAPTGTYHFANAGMATWYDFAREIFRQGNVADSVDVVPVQTHEFALRAHRPKNSVLSVHKIASDYGIVPRDWRMALESVLASLRRSAK
ncbi:dTDP-4-dehydrorhamnose reductase [Ensifer sp. ZNC0028]|uniref:dTDP-4-dehydrorhamnose reductase n=1 Tax=unclassified Ensifer TaxID=2633371 RepID=UPI0009DDE654|nr:dTDP-4-dehydrorhamnose reductase [Ensifer sp. ZNC0028]